MKRGMRASSHWFDGLLYPFEISQAMQQAIPNAMLATIPGDGSAPDSMPGPTHGPGSGVTGGVGRVHS